MTFRGIIKAGKVELESGVELPEGTVVNVEPSRRNGAGSKRYNRSSDPAFNLSQFAVSTGRRDGAAEHDHYVYGSPKRSEAPTRKPKRKPAAKVRKRS
jgi:hypothetical protein